jgi:hypothetical protein
MTSALVPVTVDVARTFERLGISYLVAGSLASGLHGEVRFTHDVDFVAAMRPEHVEPFVEAVEDRFFVHVEDVRSAVADKRMFNLLVIRQGLKVDVHVREPLGFHGSELARARQVRIGPGADSSVRVGTPEDVLLWKLVWYRMRAGLSDVQWRDVAGILKTRGAELDWDPLDRYAAVLDVEDLLRRAKTEAGLGDGTR